MGVQPPISLSLRLQRAALWLLAACLVGTALFFYTQTRDQFELPKQLLLRALSSGILGLLLAQKLSDPGTGWRRGPLDLPVLAWSAWLLVGTFSSVAPWVSWRGEYENFSGSLTQLNYAALYFASLQVLRKREDALLLLRTLLGAALGAGLYALMQAGHRDLIGWAANSVVGDRYFGPLGNPNFLGGLMAMAIPLKLALAWDGRSAAAPDPERVSRWAVLALWLLAYAVLGKASLWQLWLPQAGADFSSQAVLWAWLASLAAAPLLRRSGRPGLGYGLGQAADLLLYFQVLANTGTRGAFLGLMIGLAVLVLAWSARQGLRLFSLRSLASLGLLTLLLGGAFAGLGPSFRTRMAHSLRAPRQALEQSRLEIWLPALEIWKDHPILGTGVDSFKTVFPSYSLSRFNRYDGENVSSRMAHCEPLQVAATQGTVGLLLWLWLCGAFFVAWWKRSAAQAEAWWLGLGALMAAYLGQNLVSFGVAGISTAFWAFLALPALGEERSLTLPWRRWSHTTALAAGAALLVVCLGAVSRTTRADLAYSYASQAQDQLPALEKAGIEDLRGVAAYGYQELAADPGSLDADERAEFDQWRQALLSAEQRLQAAPDASATLLPFYRRASGALLMLLAARSMERAVALCPHEVKYQVYLGLAYEELFHRAQPARREIWFKKAAEAYRRSVALNPGNAYYRGNLGRLFASAAEAGNQAFYKQAEARYLEAVKLAPVTRLFYENLILLEAHYAGLEVVSAVMDQVQARDPELAPSLLIAAASTLFQWRDSGLPVWTPAKRKAATAAALDWAQRAQSLHPGDAEQTLALAIFAQAAGHRADAQRWAQEALRLKPGDAQLKAVVQQRGLLR